MAVLGEGALSYERGTPVVDSISELGRRWSHFVRRERTPGPSCPQTPAGGLSTWSCWSCNQSTLSGVPRRDEGRAEVGSDAEHRGKVGGVLCRERQRTWLRVWV